MKNACKKYVTIPVSFDKIDKMSGHPTIQGMQDIADGVLSALKTE